MIRISRQPVFLYVPFYCVSDGETCPSLVRFEVNHSFIKKLLKLQKLALRNMLTEVRAPNTLIYNHARDNYKSLLRITGLHVTSSMVWFTGTKHLLDPHVFSHVIKIEELLCALKSREQEGEGYTRFGDKILMSPKVVRASFVDLLTSSGELAALS